jgi:hypothetical protein
LRNSFIYSLSLSFVLTSCGGTSAPQRNTEEIRLGHVATIGPGLGVVAPTDRAVFHRLDDATYAATPLHEPGTVGLFSSEGRLIATYGTAGAGPREFSAPRFIASDGEQRIHILDPGNSRISVWSRKDSLIRTVPLRSPTVRIWPLRDNDHLTQRLIVDGDQTSRVFAIISKSGVTKLEFGPDKIDYINNMSAALAADSTIWTLLYNEYTLLQYDLTGKLLGRISSDRFKRFTRTHARARIMSGQKLSVGYALGTLPSGLLAVLIGHIQWDRRGMPQKRTEHAPVDGVSARSRVIDFTVDVWDPASMRLVGTTAENDRFFVGFTNAGELVEARERNDGIVVFDLWRITNF